MENNQENKNFRPVQHRVHMKNGDTIEFTELFYNIPDFWSFTDECHNYWEGSRQIQYWQCEPLNSNMTWCSFPLDQVSWIESLD